VERIFAIDPVLERRARAEAYGVEVFDFGNDSQRAIMEASDGRGPDSVIDAVGMEAHGSPVAAFAHTVTGLLPAVIAAPMTEKAGVDRLAALHLAIQLVRRGGTVSIIGVYGGAIDPMPMFTLFDKQIQLRMGQANVRRWVNDLMPLVLDDADPLGTESFATHHVSLADGPRAYEMFQKKEDGAVKVVFSP